MKNTHWCVITGGPSSGKTTLIQRLAAAGYTTVPEVARAYIQQLLATHYTLEDIRKEPSHLQRGILAMALKRERGLDQEQLIFFDRGTPDSIGYFNYYHLDATHIKHSCQHKGYQKIFYCHQLPVQYDSVRIEDNLSAKQIGDHIYAAYCDLGYELIELPAVSVEQRIEIILSHVTQP